MAVGGGLHKTTNYKTPKRRVFTSSERGYMETVNLNMNQQTYGEWCASALCVMFNHTKVILGPGSMKSPLYPRRWGFVFMISLCMSTRPWNSMYILTQFDRLYWWYGNNSPGPCVECNLLLLSSLLFPSQWQIPSLALPFAPTPPLIWNVRQLLCGFPYGNPAIRKEQKFII